MSSVFFYVTLVYHMCIWICEWLVDNVCSYHWYLATDCDSNNAVSYPPDIKDPFFTICDFEKRWNFVL